MTTLHGLMRTKERTGRNEAQALRMIENASRRGKTHEAFCSLEKEYIRQQGQKGINCRAVVYNDYCFIFGREDVCITMYKLPPWFGRKVHFDGKTRIRNVRQYYRELSAIGRV